MKKEIQLILTGSLFLASCQDIVAKAKSDIDSLTPVASPVPTESLPTPIPTPYLLDIVQPPTPESESMCIMPVENAEIDRGLQFLSIIRNGTGEVRNKDGSPHLHLGWDMHADFGEPVLAPCEGEFVWSGRVPNGDGTLGNVVVIKFSYEENGETKAVFGRFAHMENVISGLVEGDKIIMGTKIGEVGASGGGWRTPHLHFDLWTEKAWEVYLNNDTFRGDLAHMAGFYPEYWNEGLIKREMVNPREWLFSRLKPH